MMHPVARSLVEAEDSLEFWTVALRGRRLADESARDYTARTNVMRVESSLAAQRLQGARARAASAGVTDSDIAAARRLADEAAS